MAISAGGHHTCGLGEDGVAVCWGSGVDGQSSPPSGETFQGDQCGRATYLRASRGRRGSLLGQRSNRSVERAGWRDIRGHKRGPGSYVRPAR